jgi:hypothetical protein
MLDPSSLHLGYTVVVLAIIGAFHGSISILKIIRIFATELRDELHEWRKFFRGG